MPAALVAVLAGLAAEGNESVEAVRSTFAVMGLHLWLQARGRMGEAEIARQYLVARAAAQGRTEAEATVVLWREEHTP
jgi:hypothetical protein